MLDLQKKLDKLLQIIKEEAEDIIQNADQYSKEELTEVRTNIGDIAQKAEEKLNAIKLKRKEKVGN